MAPTRVEVLRSDKIETAILDGWMRCVLLVRLALVVKPGSRHPF